MEDQRVYCVRIINEVKTSEISVKLKDGTISLEEAEKGMQENFYMLKTYDYLLASTIQQNMTIAGYFCEIDIEFTSKFDKKKIT